MSAAEFKAYAAMSKSAPCVPWSYKPMTLGPHDLDIKISHCGVCHSDIHEIDCGWPVPTTYPLVPGHEVVGTVVAKGAEVSKFALGDRVGLGPQCYACFEKNCPACSIGQDCCCPKAVYTYDSKYANGAPTYGGFAEAVRTHDSLVVKIPAALPSDAAAPLLCAGVTVWAPLIEHGVKKGVKCAVVGLGGLGHLAVQFASKLGADVTVVSQSASKKADAQKMGAHHFIVSKNEAEMNAAAGAFDVLLVAGAGKGMNYNQYIKLVKTQGKLVMVGLPEEEVHFWPGNITARKITVVGSILAPLKLTEEMLAFCAQHHVLPLIEKLPMAQVNDAVARVRRGEVRYRMVLEN